MPFFDLLVEQADEENQPAKPQKIAVSPFVYDITQGGTQGILQALACALLNPLDKKNTELVTGTKAVPVEFPKPLVSSYWKGIYQNVKGVFPNEPWKGTYYGLSSGIPRNALIFTVLPLLRDVLHESFTPTQSRIIAGTSAGVLDAFVSARNRALKTIAHTSGEGTNAKAVWKAMENDRRSDCLKASFLWGSIKGVFYWGYIPVVNASV